jgi:DNA topoisomerase-3
MRVFVAEKPSLGRAIAAVLPGPQERHKTHIISGEGNVVVWCASHLLAQCMPEDYNPAHEKWALDHLPIVPDDWRLKLAPKARELYNTIKRYVKQATVIVHAGDPDREGQWVVDAVLE